jgi:hypothetical protein
VSELAKRTAEFNDQRILSRGVIEDTYVGHPTHTANRLLRKCRQWQRGRTANERNELAPSHVPPMSGGLVLLEA